MLKILSIIIAAFFFLHAATAQEKTAAFLGKPCFLIAHRGGIVQGDRVENSRPAIEEAIHRGYYGVEVDLRLTKDSIFIIQHDPTFKRYYGVDKPVSSMDWNEIRRLRSAKGGSGVLRLEEVLHIAEGKIQLMIDNKIQGMDSALFTRLVSLLRKHGLLERALMIGTEASTPFFRGKIKLSCTREQLEANMKKPGYSPSDYYLFGTPENLSERDIRWAEKNNIQVIAAVNRFRYRDKTDPEQEAKQDIEKMVGEGVVYFQIDSEFDAPFFP